MRNEMRDVPSAMRRSKTHLLFDFFGTLVRYSASRTEQGYEESHRLLAKAGCRLSYGQFLRAWETVSDDFEERATRARTEYSMEALVTNTHHAELIREHLRRLDVEQYFAAVTSVEHGRRKPHPGIFADTLELVGGASSASIYVGDSYAADYLGATSAGIDCLLIDPEREHDIPTTRRIGHISELRQALRRG